MCFTLQWLGQLLVWAAIIGAVYAIVSLLLPYAFKNLGEPGTVILRVLTIIMWAVIAIFVIWICIDLIQCLLSMGGGLHLPSAPRR